MEQRSPDNFDKILNPKTPDPSPTPRLRHTSVMAVTPVAYTATPDTAHTNPTRTSRLWTAPTLRPRSSHPAHQAIFLSCLTVRLRRPVSASSTTPTTARACLRVMTESQLSSTASPLSSKSSHLSHRHCPTKLSATPCKELQTSKAVSLRACDLAA